MPLENVLHDMVLNPTATDLWSIASRATEAKRKELREYGWEMNHNITEGDVRMVLAMLKQHASEQDR